MKELNSRVIRRDVGAIISMIWGGLFMLVAASFYGMVVWDLFRKMDTSVEHYIFNMILGLVFYTAFFLVLFFYFFGFRVFREGYRRKKKLSGDYYIREDFVASVSYSAKGRGIIKFRDCHRFVNTGVVDVARGEKYYLVFSAENNEIWDIYPAKGYYLPGHKEEAVSENEALEKLNTTVEIDGERIVVGEEERVMNALNKQSYKIVNPILAVSFIVGVVVCVLTKSIAGVFVGVGVLFFLLPLVSFILEFFIARFGKPVKATVLEVKKFKDAKEVTYKFTYNGEERQLKQTDTEPRSAGRVYDAKYLPGKNKLYVIEKGGPDMGVFFCCLFGVLFAAIGIIIIYFYS